jgi:uncharacterized protein
MPLKDLPPDLARLSLTEVEAAIAARQLPPVDRWHPPHRGSSEMRIAADGRWFHQGGEIKRPAMVQLFASILRREPDGSHVLVTPAEKLDIIVDDAPFVAIGIKSEGEGEARRIGFRLNTDEAVIAGPDHAIRIAGTGDDVRPYLHVRGGLEARIAHGVWYDLADWAIAEGAAPLAIWSNGARFVLEAA